MPDFASTIDVAARSRRAAARARAAPPSRSSRGSRSAGPRRDAPRAARSSTRPGARPYHSLGERLVGEPVRAGEVDDDRAVGRLERGRLLVAEAEEDHVGAARAPPRGSATNVGSVPFSRGSSAWRGPAGERVGAERDQLELRMARAAGRASPGRCSRPYRGWRRSSRCAYYAHTMQSMQTQSHLVLEDGTVFPGISVGAPGVAAGEACFTTAMTGYEEAVTDPSYVAQVLCFAYPLIGTYGVDESRMESDRVQCEGVVMRDVRPEFAGVAARAGRRRAHRRRHADARAQDPRRRRPALRARRRAGRRAAGARARRAADRRPAARPPGRARRSRTRSAPGPRVVVVDLGSKRSIPRRLADAGLEAYVVPGSWDADAILDADPRVGADRERPGRPGRAHRPGRDDPHAARPRAALRRLPRPPAARARARPRDLQAAVRPPRREPSRARRRRPAACSSPSRTTASRCSPNGDISHVSLNDGTCEGLAGDGFAERAVPSRGVARPARRASLLRPAGRGMPKRTDLRSILILGSGPIRIGQACEFDYSGAQACRVLRREGYRVVLVNSNPATIMTDPEWADATYLEPLDAETVAQVIERERPDAILPTLGGQTALNLAVELAPRPIVGIELIGADLDAIQPGRGPRALPLDRARRRDPDAALDRRALARRRVPRAGDRPAGLHARRHRRRHRLDAGGAARRDRARPRGEPGRPGARRGVPRRAGRSTSSR